MAHDERILYQFIESSTTSGMWTKTLKLKSNLHQSVVTRCLKSLESKSLIKEIRSVTNKPIAVGFGISTPEQAHQVQDWGADGVVVGSAFVQRLGENTPNQGLRVIKDFCTDLKAAITPTAGIKN